MGWNGRRVCWDCADVKPATWDSRVGPAAWDQPADDWGLTASNDSDLLGACPAECNSLSS
jgi:hypothetical protein